MFFSHRASLTPSSGKQVLHSTCLPSHIPTSAPLYSLYFAQEERPTCLSLGTFTPALVITLTVLDKCRHLGSVHSIITTAIIVPAKCWHFGDGSVCKTVTVMFLVLGYCSFVIRKSNKSSVEKRWSLFILICRPLLCGLMHTVWGFFPITMQLFFGNYWKTLEKKDQEEVA